MQWFGVPSLNFEILYFDLHSPIYTRIPLIYISTSEIQTRKWLLILPNDDWLCGNCVKIWLIECDLRQPTKQQPSPPPPESDRNRKNKKKSSCFSSYRPSPNGVVNILTTGPRTYDETKRRIQKAIRGEKNVILFPCVAGWLRLRQRVREEKKINDITLLNRASDSSSQRSQVRRVRAHFSGKRKEDDFTALLAAAGGKAELWGGCAEGSEWKLHSDYHQVFRVPLARLVLHRFVFFVLVLVLKLILCWNGCAWRTWIFSRNTLSELCSSAKWRKKVKTVLRYLSNETKWMEWTFLRAVREVVVCVV